MTKKILSILLLVAICITAFVSCRKTTNSKIDGSLNYFPLIPGKSVTYAVDSIYFNDTDCTKREVKTQQKYVITDTFTDKKKRASYILNVFSRPYEGADWHPINVIYVTPTAEGLLYAQDNAQYIKMVFPVANGLTWKGNKNIETNDSMFSYLNGWNYTYQNLYTSYNTGYINFNNTVTVMEDDESVNYPGFDSIVHAYRTYAKEVYAFNVGMVYKEWTHWTYRPYGPGRPHSNECVNGYTVVMRAIDHN